MCGYIERSTKVNSPFSILTVLLYVKNFHPAYIKPRVLVGYEMREKFVAPV